MPDIPLRYTDPKSLQADKRARENSPLYGGHPTCTVYQYMHMKPAERERIQQELRDIERAKKKE